MSDLRNGEIVPGERVGRFFLGEPLAELERRLPQDHTREEHSGHWVLATEAMMFWVRRPRHTVSQILVRDGFEGKLFGAIGLGDTLDEVRERIGSVVEDELGSVYVREHHPVVCFELADVSAPDEPWDERTAPIEYISIYGIEVGGV